MSAYTLNQTLPRKCGVVLTCLDNGRKRFRAVPVSEDGVQSHAPDMTRETEAGVLKASDPDVCGPQA